MSKKFGVTPSEFRRSQRKLYSNLVGGQIDAEEARRRNKSEPKQGIKVQVLNVYREKGKSAAWEELKSKKLGYTWEMFERWIQEYEKSQQGR